MRAFEAFADILLLRKDCTSRQRKSTNRRQDSNARRAAFSICPFRPIVAAALPDMAVIEKEIARAASITEALRQINLDDSKVQKRIADIEASLQALAREVRWPLPKDMRANPQQRDRAVDQLETEPEIDPREKELSALCRAAPQDSGSDRQADVLLGGADRAAQAGATAR